jgi:hypothetical protein
MGTAARAPRLSDCDIEAMAAVELDAITRALAANNLRAFSLLADVAAASIVDH